MRLRPTRKRPSIGEADLTPGRGGEQEKERTTEGSTGCKVGSPDGDAEREAYGNLIPSTKNTILGDSGSDRRLQGGGESAKDTNQLLAQAISQASLRRERSNPGQHLLLGESRYRVQTRSRKRATVGADQKERGEREEGLLPRELNRDANAGEERAGGEGDRGKERYAENGHTTKKKGDRIGADSSSGIGRGLRTPPRRQARSILKKTTCRRGGEIASGERDREATSGKSHERGPPAAVIEKRKVRARSGQALSDRGRWGDAPSKGTRHPLRGESGPDSIAARSLSKQ